MQAKGQRGSWGPHRRARCHMTWYDASWSVQTKKCEPSLSPAQQRLQMEICMLQICQGLPDHWRKFGQDFLGWTWEALKTFDPIIQGYSRNSTIVETNETSEPRKNPALLSMEYWLFNRILIGSLWMIIMVYQNPHITGQYKQPVFFIAQASVQTMNPTFGFFRMNHHMQCWDKHRIRIASTAKTATAIAVPTIAARFASDVLPCHHCHLKDWSCCWWVC